jgi:sialic acid synthase SpsE
VILSTGMASHAEIAESIGTLRDAGCRELLVLHCTSGYPTPPDEANIRMIPHLAEMFDVPVGLSDHTLDKTVAVTAVALGAAAIEKHFTLNRADGGPDAAFSLEPSEFADLSRRLAQPGSRSERPTTYGHQGSKATGCFAGRYTRSRTSGRATD